MAVCLNSGEAGRLAVLEGCQLLGTPPEPVFDRLTRLAALLFDAPLAMVSLVGADCLWIKSRYGFDLAHAPRRGSYCTQAILGTEPLVVYESAGTPALPGVEFYIGVPLIVRGAALGTLAIMDTKPRSPLAGRELAGLCDLAVLVQQEIERRGSSPVEHLEAVREGERIRIAREIHDELGQLLSVLKLDLDGIERRYCQSVSQPSEDMVRRLAAMREYMKQGITAVHRISSELRPGVLDHLGIAAAISWQVDEFRWRTGIACETRGLPEHLPLDAQQSTGVFRILQEILTNIVRHAQATLVTLEIKMEGGWFTLRVADNGKGFDWASLADPQALGLLGMRERALLLRGGIDFDSYPGKGTAVTLRVPAASASVKPRVQAAFSGRM